MRIVLKPSSIHGVGVFAVSKIKKGSKLDLFAKNDWQLVKSLSPLEKRYCIKDVSGWHCPKNFNQMSIGWFLNHSTKPNVETESWKTLKEIKKGDELLINYNFL